MATIDVLLATFDGERYLPDLLASLMAQTLPDFRLLVRDDGSRDGTVALLREWQQRHPGRIDILDTDAPTGSASGNFNRLMLASDADYVLFADQDDIWHADKVERTVAALIAAEGVCGGGAKPVMAVCDLALVDGQGRPLFPSFRAYQGLDMGKGLRLGRLLLNNVVTGCAMGVNRAAIAGAAPVPAAAYMHDWWLALVCAALGTVHAMPEVLIDYRQHAGNVVGAQRVSPWATLARVLRRFDFAGNRRRHRAWLARLQGQAGALATRHDAALAAPDRAMLRAFQHLTAQSWPARVATILRYGFYLPSRSHTLAMILR